MRRPSPTAVLLLAIAASGCKRARAEPRIRPAAVEARPASDAPPVETTHAPNAAAPVRASSPWHLFAVSGAGDAEDNAIAHERNVRFVLDTATQLGVAPARQHVLIADGDDPSPDIHYEEADPIERRRLYALGLLQTGAAESRNALARVIDHTVRGSRADLATLERTLRDDAAASSSPAAPPMLFYVTDHGREAPRHDDSYIVLWGDDDIDVRALGALLDLQPPQRRVVTVMSQCYSGAFSALVHEHGDPRRPIAAHDRCGFFAAPADRPSAGCTPETDETHYDDYTTWFFAALGGRSRSGGAASDADRDGDGVVSYDEAHAYALIRDETTDVPVSSSEEYLRRAFAPWLARATAGRTAVRAFLPAARPMVRDTAHALLTAAGLDDTVSFSTLARDARARRARCAPALCETLDALDAARAGAHAALREAVLAHRIPGVVSPDVTSLHAPAADALVRAGQPYLAAIERLEDAADALARADDRDEARLERIRRLAELAALEAHVREVGGEVLANYERIRRCEASTLSR
jgi:hypothetical protein